MRAPKILFILTVACWAVSARAFIPPIPGIIKEIFDGRKPVPLEVVFRHRVEAKPGELIDIEERLLHEHGHVYVLWKGTGVNNPVPASWERMHYAITPERTLPSRSGVFIKYLLWTNGEDFKDQLLAEQFIRRDQMMQYKPGFSTEGDPQTWDLRNGYMRHSDVFLRRLGANVAIMVMGLDEPALKKGIGFDKNLKGVRRLEWRDGQSSLAWNFEVFGRMGTGYYPKRLTFEADGKDVITSELIAVRALKDKSLADFKNQWRAGDRTTPFPGNFEAALRVLLSYR